MKSSSILKTGIIALCAAILCGSCIVQKDNPHKPPHHKKAKKPKKPKKPKKGHMYGEADTDRSGDTYYAWRADLTE